LIALIIFGPKKLPELGRGLGGGMREFKHSVTGALPSAGRPGSEPAREPEPARETATEAR
ncbi:MAG: twin-arginine translocase TatA/TatE family subunit, partial [Solirubrobacterales bacterium]